MNSLTGNSDGDGNISVWASADTVPVNVKNAAASHENVLTTFFIDISPNYFQCLSAKSR
jgi:hypothetical protein